MSQEKLDDFLAERLLGMSDYREFLSEYLTLRRESGETLSSLSKRAGLSSAGFLSDVLKGKKDLSAKSLPLVKGALLVPSGVEEFFELLVYSGRPDLAPAHLRGAKIQTALRALRGRLREGRKSTEYAPDDLHDIMGSFDAHLLFAALEPDRGMTRAELAERTGLAAPVIERGIALFSRMKLVYEFDGRIHSHKENFDSFGEEFNSSFQVTFQRALEVLRKKAERIPEHQKDMFYFSVFLVNESDYEDIQMKLRNKLFQEMDKVLPQSGEKVAAMVFSIFLPPKSED